jgi:PGF-CTERM protein
VFQGAVDSIAQIEGLWLIDYANSMTIESDDEFGSLDDVSIQGDTLRISNEDTFTLTMGNEEEIAEGMYFKIGDTPVSELRYYPFVIRVLGNETMTTTPGEEENVTETPEENVTEEGNITETPEEDVTEIPEETTEEEPITEETSANETEEGEDSPGFGLVLGLIGLLAVVYLFRRNN